MKKLILLSVAALGLIASPAMAGEDGGAYVGAGGAWIEDAGLALYARAGYSFNSYFGVEADGAFGISDKTVTGTTASLGMKTSIAGYAVGRLPVSEQFDLIARVGYHSTEIEAKNGALSASATTNGVAYGGGAEFKFDDANSIRADFTIFSDNGSVNTASIGYVRRF